LGYGSVEVVDQRVNVDAVGRSTLLDVLKSGNGAAKAHQTVLQKDLNGLGVVLHYLTNRHLSGNGLHPDLPSIVAYALCALFQRRLAGIDAIF
jgi:hypothetical protein